MIAGGSDDGKIPIWDARTGNWLRTLEEHNGWVSTVAFSPDGFSFAAGGKKAILLWDVRTGEHLMTLAGQTALIRSVAFSPLGFTLASASLDRTIRIWDVSTGEHLQTLEGHAGSVRFVTFSPDGSTLASTSSDGTMLFWDLRHITTWGEIKQSEPVGGTRRSAELSPWAAPIIPMETALLSNYPNPFNPETWIPYQLKKPAEITMTIFNIHGQAVRTLEVGHRPPGVYRNRERAAYWDGRNKMGEAVANGVYFYRLTAGDFSATRKMLVGK